MEISAASDGVEVISRAYARRHGIARTDDWLMLKLTEEVGELTQAYLRLSGQSRPHDGDARAALGAEIADSLAQLLVLARRFDIDIEAELERKWFSWRDVVDPVDCLGIAAGVP